MSNFVVLSYNVHAQKGSSKNWVSGLAHLGTGMVNPKISHLINKCIRMPNFFAVAQVVWLWAGGSKN